MEGHLDGGTGVDGRQLTSRKGGGGEQRICTRRLPSLHQKVPGAMCCREGHAGEPALPLRTASGPQSYASRGKDDHFPEWSHLPHTPQCMSQ